MNNSAATDDIQFGEIGATTNKPGETQANVLEER